jgi:hypothetical protein
MRNSLRLGLTAVLAVSFSAAGLASGRSGNDATSTPAPGGTVSVSPKPDEPLNPSNRNGIIIEGRTKNPSGNTAIGPKPDEPLNPSSRANRAAPSDGPGMSGTGGSHGIIIEGKTNDGQGTVRAGQRSGNTAIGPKPDEPRNPSRTSTGPLVNPRNDTSAPEPH